jgi:hypothetical protein
MKALKLACDPAAAPAVMDRMEAAFCAGRGAIEKPEGVLA